jgi:hypothetical protein
MLPHITKIRDAVARAVSVAALALPACPASPAQAQSVVPCNDVPALISAINAANAAPNLSSILLAPNCVYHLTAETGPLPAITTPVVITGNNATLQRDEGAPGFRILEVGAGGNLTVRSLTVTGGNVTGDGGGIFVAATGTRTGTSVRVIGNASTINGGGIANQGTTRLTFSTVSQNAANPESFGGGIYNSGTLTLTGTNVTGNTAYGGSGVINDIGGRLDVTGGRLSGNTGMFGGGLYNDGNATLVNVVVEQNSGSLGAGGIYNSGTLTVRIGRITGNTAPEPGAGTGAGLYNESGATATLVAVPIQNNVAAEDGGGVYNSGTVLTTLPTITGNTPNNCSGPNPVPGCVG